MRYNARKSLWKASTDAVSIVNSALVTLYDKKIWRVNESDSLRLMKIILWSHRYSVSVEYILSAIIPVFSKAVQRRTGRKTASLGVSIAALTGEVAEDILKERLSKDFPGQENVMVALENKRNEMVSMLDEEDGPGKPRSVLSYHSVKEYIKAYESKINNTRQGRLSTEEQIAKMTFRGNPFV